MTSHGGTSPRALVDVADSDLGTLSSLLETGQLKAPHVHFDPRTASVENAISLHAKCVVIDHSLALITSANFTDRGQTRNFEAGVLIEDRAFAGTTLERQWANLVEAGVLIQGH